jgi:hypothetical protein
LDHLEKYFLIYVLWRDALGLELGHCGCGPGELDEKVVILLPTDLDVDRVHVKLDDELGVYVEQVERLFVTRELGSTRVPRCVHERVHHPEKMHHIHHRLTIFTGESHNLVDGGGIFRLPYHHHIILEAYLGVVEGGGKFEIDSGPNGCRRVLASKVGERGPTTRRIPNVIATDLDELRARE